MMEYLLGIDIGTTTAKLVVVNSKTKEEVGEASAPHNAELHNLPPHHHEQSPEIIIGPSGALHDLIREFGEANPEVLEAVTAIGVSGQMHGCMMWDSLGWASSLITWMDGRGTAEFITSLPPTNRSNILHSGYGTVSLAWLQRNGQIPTDRPVTTGTIMDYLVCRLTGSKKSQMTHMLADSWGYFDPSTQKWDDVFLRSEIVPGGILPVIVEAGRWAGVTSEPFFGVKPGTPVLAALGDFQAHFYAAEKTNAAILNMGTSSQLSFEMPEGFHPPNVAGDPRKPIQYFPFLEGRYVGIAPSLNGGNILGAFLQAFKSWVDQLAPGTTLPDDDALWERMEVLLAKWESETAQFPIPTTTPLLYGERHAPDATASITGLTEPNMSHLAGILGSLVVGLVSNLFSMITPELLRNMDSFCIDIGMLRKSGVKEIVLTGMATKPWFEPAVKRFLGKQQFTVSTIHSEAEKRLDSAYGSALIAGRYLRTRNAAS